MARIAPMATASPRVTASAATAASLSVDVIAARINVLRGQRVMLDSDLAALYEEPTIRQSPGFSICCVL